MSGKRVCYFYHPFTWCTSLDQDHPIHPMRIQLTYDLILEYGLHHKMKMLRPQAASLRQLNRFHSMAYLQFLQRAEESSKREKVQNFGVDDNYPVFQGLLHYCQLVASASVSAASKLNSNQADIAINWSGGFYQAQTSQACGFNYINDVALALLELLKQHERVIYINLGPDQCDTIQEAFSTNNRVMIVTFPHCESKYFQGNDWINQIGFNQSSKYSLNIPLADNIDDETYGLIFQPIISKVVQCYQPKVIVLQSGESLIAEKYANGYHLTPQGHGGCLQFLKSFNMPILLLGGGNYSTKNISHRWVYGTAIAIGQDISNITPCNNWF
ncbi:uncharacterized protein TRIADDRAFT_26667, partial [Trichoplax adhaerens]